ncbi:metallophosphoesterase [Olivibacter domesticus]|uniref:metallophosphoesterase n=1 Tax=Olivibacter domesticus TaxID=407022 RepID=UPI000ABDF868|nr:metallophosphoesterase [Olivibacter domesticus]
MNRLFKKSIVCFITLHFFLSASSQEAAYTPPALTDSNAWSMILLPDPQTYVKFSRNQPIWELMTSWVSENIQPLHIEMVLCTGDLVEQNNILMPVGQNGNQASANQWRSVARGFSRLDGQVPYIAATGNHDYGFKSAENRQTNYNQYFPADKNPKSQALLKEVGLNIDQQPSLTKCCLRIHRSSRHQIPFYGIRVCPTRWNDCLGKGGGEQTCLRRTSRGIVDALLFKC